MLSSLKKKINSSFCRVGGKNTGDMLSDLPMVKKKKKLASSKNRTKTLSLALSTGVFSATVGSGLGNYAPELIPSANLPD